MPHRLNPDQLAEARDWCADVSGGSEERRQDFYLMSAEDIVGYLNRWYRTSDHEGCDRTDAFIEDFPPELFITEYERETRALVGLYDRLAMRHPRHFPGVSPAAAAVGWEMVLTEFLYRRYGHCVPKLYKSPHVFSVEPSEPCKALLHRNPTKQQALYAYNVIQRALAIHGRALRATPS